MFGSKPSGWRSILFFFVSVIIIICISCTIPQYNDITFTLHGSSSFFCFPLFVHQLVRMTWHDTHKKSGAVEHAKTTCPDYVRIYIGQNVSFEYALVLRTMCVRIPDEKLQHTLHAKVRRIDRSFV